MTMTKTEIIARITILEKLITRAEDIIKGKIEVSSTAYREAIGAARSYETEFNSLKCRLQIMTEV